MSKPKNLIASLLEGVNLRTGENDLEGGDEFEDEGGGAEAFASQLSELIQEGIQGARIRTYADVGMLTNDVGLAVETPTGRFQITIVEV